MKNEEYYKGTTAPVEILNKRVEDFHAIAGFVIRTATVLSDGSVMLELMSLTARGGTQGRKTLIVTGWRWFDK